MKSRVESTGKTCRNEIINDAREIYKQEFENDPSFSSDSDGNSTFFKIEYVNGLREKIGERIPLRIYNRKSSSIYGFTQEFHSLYDCKIFGGDIFYDIKENEYWICTEQFNIDDVHFKGKMTKCENNIYWQDNDGNIVERRCYIANASSYSSGENTNATITLFSNQFIVYLPLDDQVLTLRDNKRIFIDNDLINPEEVKYQVYRLTRPDRITNRQGKKGYSYSIFTLDKFNNENDKLIEIESNCACEEGTIKKKIWIADYNRKIDNIESSNDSATEKKEDIDNIEQEKTDIDVKIIGKSSLKIGFAKVYSLEFVNSSIEDLGIYGIDWNYIFDLGKIERYCTKYITDKYDISIAFRDKNAVGNKIKISLFDIKHNKVLDEIYIDIVNS